MIAVRPRPRRRVDPLVRQLHVALYPIPVLERVEILRDVALPRSIRCGAAATIARKAVAAGIGTEVLGLVHGRHVGGSPIA